MNADAEEHGEGAQGIEVMEAGGRLDAGEARSPTLVCPPRSVRRGARSGRRRAGQVLGERLQDRALGQRDAHAPGHGGADRRMGRDRR